MYRNFVNMTEEEWDSAVTSAGRIIQTKAVINGTTLYGDGTDGCVVSIQFDEIMDTKELSMGRTSSSKCKLTIREPSTPIAYENGSFVPYVGFTHQGKTELVPLGEFFVVSAPSYGGGTVTLEGYDRFALLAEQYEPTISFPATLTAVMNDLSANRFTYSFTLPNITIEEPKDGTVRDWIGWVAGLCGKNARFGRNGELEFVYYDGTDWAIDEEAQYMGGREAQALNDITVRSVTSGTEEEPITSGNGRGITFTNPFMTQDILDGIYSEIETLAYRPCDLEWRGNPALQCGDSVQIEVGESSIQALVMEHTLTVESGMKDDLRCYGQSEAEIRLDTSPTAQKINAVYAQLQTALNNAMAIINGARGGIFEVTDNNGDSVNDGWIIKQSASPNWTGKTIVANYEGIGFSSDGGATMNVAITTDGDIDGRYIRAQSITTDQIAVNELGALNDYFYVGRRRPSDASTDVVVRVGIASGITQETRGDRISFYRTSDIQEYIDGNLTDAQLDELALFYQSTTSYVLQSLDTFRIGNMMLKAQTNGGVKFVRAT